MLYIMLKLNSINIMVQVCTFTNTRCYVRAVLQINEITIIISTPVLNNWKGRSENVIIRKLHCHNSCNCSVYKGQTAVALFQAIRIEFFVICETTLPLSPPCFFKTTYGVWNCVLCEIYTI